MGYNKYTFTEETVTHRDQSNILAVDAWMLFL
jgi:hypothetical protein